uniref:Uncharacterized protein n=1 Tax=candidate division CPR3 bacterium TaxID=2268181 RepID=A0A7C4M540_UNCC3
MDTKQPYTGKSPFVETKGNKAAIFLVLFGAIAIVVMLSTGYTTKYWPTIKKEAKTVTPKIRLTKKKDKEADKIIKDLREKCNTPVIDPQEFRYCQIQDMETIEAIIRINFAGGNKNLEAEYYSILRTNLQKDSTIIVDARAFKDWINVTFSDNNMVGLVLAELIHDGKIDASEIEKLYDDKKSQQILKNRASSLDKDIFTTNRDNWEEVQISSYRPVTVVDMVMDNKWFILDKYKFGKWVKMMEGLKISYALAKITSKGWIEEKDAVVRGIKAMPEDKYFEYQVANGEITCPGNGEPSLDQTIGDSGLPINTPNTKVEKVDGIGGPGIYGEHPKMEHGAEFIPAKPKK